MSDIASVALRVLGSTDSTELRNCLTLLLKIREFFPTTETTCDELSAKVTLIAENDKGGEDLRTMSSG